jgi:hypothetical protein
MRSGWLQVVHGHETSLDTTAHNEQVGELTRAERVWGRRARPASEVVRLVTIAGAEAVERAVCLMRDW